MADGSRTEGDPGDPSVRVLISNRRAGNGAVHPEIDEPTLVALAEQTLRAEGIEHAELSVSFVDEAEIAELHTRFMDEPGATDVLSFPLDEGDADEDGMRLLGDVVIAPSVAARNNPADPEAELRLLLVHGILHLLGYDHEEDAERAEMWGRQERYTGVASP
jgi:probable rRNA maturation factor